jgi:regulator of protease activity HflC (stomatin/prohibitin superfamily)
MATIALIIVAVLAVALLAASIRVIKQYERGVQFRLGRMIDHPRGPGLILVVPSSIASSAPPRASGWPLASWVKRPTS